MKVKNVLALAATVMGSDDLAAYIMGDAADDVPSREEEKRRMISAYNLAMEELAVSYEPLIRTEIKENANEIYFSSLPDRPLEILSVTDEAGTPIKHNMLLDKIVIGSYSGKVAVSYRYLPDERGEDDECDFTVKNRMTPRVVAYATAAEFLHISGARDAANDMRAMFEKFARECLKRGKLVMPQRRWY